MQKIVIDTNVIVSSLIQRGYPNLIIKDLFIEQKFQLCISDELLAEYYEVLARPKFSKFQDFFVNLYFYIFNRKRFRADTATIPALQASPARNQINSATSFLSA